MLTIEAPSVNNEAMYDALTNIAALSEHIPNILSYKLHSTPDSIVGEFFKNYSAETPSFVMLMSTYCPF